MTATVGIIGGSGFYTALGEELETRAIDTPFGPPSGPLTLATIADHRVVFLPRHGTQHGLLPSEIDARANIWALESLGVSRVISISAVRSLREHIAPGHLVLPRRLIDRRYPPRFRARAGLAICEELADQLERVARARGETVHTGAYVCIGEPPMPMESDRYRSWGADVVGIASLPEARIARAAELCYATLTVPCEGAATHALAVLRANVERAHTIIAAAIAELPERTCGCGRVHDHALVTPHAHRPEAAR